MTSSSSCHSHSLYIYPDLGFLKRLRGLYRNRPNRPLGPNARDANGKPINPLDAQFSGLNLKFLDPTKPSCSEYEPLQEYITSTHGSHTRIRKPTILYAFRVERPGEVEDWNHGGYDQLGDGGRSLLWTAVDRRTLVVHLFPNIPGCPP